MKTLDPVYIKTFAETCMDAGLSEDQSIALYKQAHLDDLVENNTAFTAGFTDVLQKRAGLLDSLDQAGSTVSPFTKDMLTWGGIGAGLAGAIPLTRNLRRLGKGIGRLRPLATSPVTDPGRFVRFSPQLDPRVLSRTGKTAPSIDRLRPLDTSPVTDPGRFVRVSPQLDPRVLSRTGKTAPSNGKTTPSIGKTTPIRSLESLSKSPPKLFDHVLPASALGSFLGPMAALGKEQFDHFNRYSPEMLRDVHPDLLRSMGSSQGPSRPSAAEAARYPWERQTSGSSPSQTVTGSPSSGGALSNIHQAQQRVAHIDNEITNLNTQLGTIDTSTLAGATQASHLRKSLSGLQKQRNELYGSTLGGLGDYRRSMRESGAVLGDAESQIQTRLARLANREQNLTDFMNASPNSLWRQALGMVTNPTNQANRLLSEKQILAQELERIKNIRSGLNSLPESVR